MDQVTFCCPIVWKIHKAAITAGFDLYKADGYRVLEEKKKEVKIHAGFSPLAKFCLFLSSKTYLFCFQVF